MASKSDYGGLTSSLGKQPANSLPQDIIVTSELSSEPKDLFVNLVIPKPRMHMITAQMSYVDLFVHRMNMINTAF